MFLRGSKELTALYGSTRFLPEGEGILEELIDGEAFNLYPDIILESKVVTLVYLVNSCPIYYAVEQENVWTQLEGLRIPMKCVQFSVTFLYLNMDDMES